MTNSDNSSILRIDEAISKNQVGSIVLPTIATIDNVAASTALYLSLTQLGKNMTLACQNEVDFDLVGADKFEQKLVSGGDNLVVSLPYVEGSIDKVDYNIEGDHFNLIVTPRAGFPKFTQDQVKFSYSGGIANFIIAIDCPTLNSLGTLYTENKTQFQGREIINIDRHLTNANFGSINLVDKTASSVSELILELLKSLNIEFDRDIATNLYAGIAAATNNFTSYSVNAKTFENAAFLLKKGALKKLLKKPGQAVSAPNLGYPQTFNANSQPRPVNFPTQSQNNIKVGPQPQPKPRQPMMSASEKHIRPIEEVEKIATDDEGDAPTDWLKPKIFKGSGGIME